MRRMSRKAFFATFLLVALLIAGVGSFYASTHPDGLNFVAEKTGFIDQEKTSAASDGPFAGYSTKGIDDARLSGGVAGVVGVPAGAGHGRRPGLDAPAPGCRERRRRP